LISPTIKNLIFDLGGVIINLDTNRTFESFSKLSGIPAAELQQKSKQISLFGDYEKGMLTDAEFRSELKTFLSGDFSDAALDDAWNAMLLDIPKGKLHLLEQLKNTHRTFLLSNTNNIHLECFNQIVKKSTGLSDIDSYFQKAYYSHLLKMRKPDDEIYLHVLGQHDLDPAETLFMDDNRDNLEGAKRVGIKVAHIAHPDDLYSLFA
jgi:HAD superfamily hydrolase (TIGR01509 family)